MNYKSPIEMIRAELLHANEIVCKEEEKYILKTVQSYGINVNKDELIRALNYDRNQYKQGYEDAMSKFRWIPIKKMFPDKNDWYFVTVNSQDYGIFSISLMYENGGWFVDEGFGFDRWREITAWMPLPAPYKESE